MKPYGVVPNVYLGIIHSLSCGDSGIKFGTNFPRLGIKCSGNFGHLTGTGIPPKLKISGLRGSMPRMAIRFGGEYNKNDTIRSR